MCDDTRRLILHGESSLVSPVLRIVALLQTVRQLLYSNSQTRADWKNSTTVSLAIDVHDTAKFFSCLKRRGIAIRTIWSSFVIL